MKGKTFSPRNRMQQKHPRECPIDWSAVLASHNRWLRTVVYSRIGEAEAVDEVMQEVALAAIKQQSPIADPKKVAPKVEFKLIPSAPAKKKPGQK